MLQINFWFPNKSSLEDWNINQVSYTYLGFFSYLEKVMFIRL